MIVAGRAEFAGYWNDTLIPLLTTKSLPSSRAKVVAAVTVTLIFPATVAMIPATTSPKPVPRIKAAVVDAYQPGD
jgi:hypothetical protein